MSTDLRSAEALLLACGLNQAAVSALFECHSKSDASGFDYPWENLDGILREPQAEPIFLVGYGSLLNPESAARTFRDRPSIEHRPVVALGARRMFNYRMPDPIARSWGVPEGSRNRAALNAEPASGSVFNGRLIELRSGDLPGLRAREAAYDLRPVTCLYWDAPNRAPFRAFALCCGHEFWDGKRYVDNSLLPCDRYYELCRKGAEMVSPSFLQLFLKTCFLADRITTASDLEAGPSNC
jgi:hypothetical protein